MDEYKEFREDKNDISVCRNEWDKSITLYFKSRVIDRDGDNVAITISRQNAGMLGNILKDLVKSEVLE